MRPIVLATLSLLLCPACMSDNAAQQSDQVTTSRPSRPTLDYRGPRVTATVDGIQLTVDLEVPTGGFRLEPAGTSRRGDHTRVELVLTGPGKDEAVTQALETKSRRVPLVSDTGAVHVYIRQQQRGAHYVVEPAFALAAIVDR